jgi:hypothetical protein
VAQIVFNEPNENDDERRRRRCQRAGLAPGQRAAGHAACIGNNEMKWASRDGTNLAPSDHFGALARRAPPFGGAAPFAAASPPSNWPRTQIKQQQLSQARSGASCVNYSFHGLNHHSGAVAGITERRRRHRGPRAEKARPRLRGSSSPAPSSGRCPPLAGGRRKTFAARTDNDRTFITSRERAHELNGRRRCLQPITRRRRQPGLLVRLTRRH